ncbi:hypothetical protein BsWGS_07768 [Bradybaena similaris]
MSAEGLSDASVAGEGQAVSKKLVWHTGGCHCGAVRFKVKAAEHLSVDKCNCSVCEKKQISCFGATKENFILLQGEDNLTVYTFNTGTAKHIFCKTCGVQSFYVPRSNPTGYSVMPHCLDPGTVKSVRVDPYDGINWEESMRKLAAEGNCST